MGTMAKCSLPAAMTAEAAAAATSLSVAPSRTAARAAVIPELDARAAARSAASSSPDFTARSRSIVPLPSTHWASGSASRRRRICSIVSAPYPDSNPRRPLANPRARRSAASAAIGSAMTS